MQKQFDTYTVTVPKGMRPGKTFNLTTDLGPVPVVVPQGAKPGQTIEVKVPKPAAAAAVPVPVASPPLVAATPAAVAMSPGGLEHAGPIEEASSLRLVRYDPDTVVWYNNWY